MLISLLIGLLIAAIIVVAFWVIDMIPVPAPFNRILKIIIVLIALVLVVQRAGFA